MRYPTGRTAKPQPGKRLQTVEKVKWNMPTVDLTKDNFEDTILNNDIVLVDFWADWCGPCKMFAPTYEKVSERHDGVVFAKVDTESEQELAAYFQIRSIPTLMIFKEKIGIFSQPGALPEAALEDLIQQTKGLDMEAVRAEIAEHAADGDGDHSH
jgi:thioredoxin 1